MNQATSDDRSVSWSNGFPLVIGLARYRCLNEGYSKKIATVARTNGHLDDQSFAVEILMTVFVSMANVFTIIVLPKGGWACLIILVDFGSDCITYYQLQTETHSQCSLPCQLIGVLRRRNNYMVCHPSAKNKKLKASNTLKYGDVRTGHAASTAGCWCAEKCSSLL
jgi:hypothetical protein